MATLHTASIAQKYPKTKDQVAFKWLDMFGIEEC